MGVEVVKEIVQESPRQITGYQQGNTEISGFVESVLEQFPNYERYIPVHRRILIRICEKLGFEAYADNLRERYAHNTAFLREIITREKKRVKKEMGPLADTLRNVNEEIKGAEEEQARLDREINEEMIKSEVYRLVRESLRGQYTIIKEGLQKSIGGSISPEDAIKFYQQEIERYDQLVGGAKGHIPFALGIKMRIITDILPSLMREKRRLDSFKEGCNRELYFMNNTLAIVESLEEAAASASYKTARSNTTT